MQLFIDCGYIGINVTILFMAHFIVCSVQSPEKPFQCLVRLVHFHIDPSYCVLRRHLHHDVVLLFCSIEYFVNFPKAFLIPAAPDQYLSF